MEEKTEENLFKNDCSHLENIDNKHFVYKGYKICRGCGVLLKNEKVNILIQNF